jgi:apoptosis-inducing factor 3
MTEPSPDTARQDFDEGIELAVIPDGTMVGGCWRGKPVLLVNEGGQYRALAGTCTHMGAPLHEGILAGGEVRCPWHHARFSLETGDAVGAPAFAPLERYGTVVRDGRVFIQKAEQKPAVHARAGSSTARVVIVGAGAAGFACAEWLERSRYDGSVTVLSEDSDAPYDRTACSKDYLSGSLSRQDSQFAPAQRWLSASEGPVLRVGCKVHAIDTQKKLVRLDAGQTVPFDVLVLALGADPRRPQWQGSDLANVHVLRTLRDADAVIAASDRAKRVTVVGASFIGLEVAASLRQRKLEVDVVTRDEVLLKKLMGADVGQMIRQVHEQKGVRFHFGRQVGRFDGQQVTLDDGTLIAADFVVAGLGVTPRTELARAAGLACASNEAGAGVTVDASLQTSCRGIYAVGDIAHYPDPHSGELIRVEHWVHAQRQGQHVARVILNQASGYSDVPFFWSSHFDTGLLYVGHVGSIIESSTEGSIADHDFCLRLRGVDREQALVSCNRDKASLQQEAAWDHSRA